MRAQSIINLLKFSGNDICEDNVSILAESIIYLCEEPTDAEKAEQQEKAKEKEDARKKRRKQIGRAALRILAGAALGTGIGAASNAITQAATGAGIAGASNGIASAIGAGGGGALGAGTAMISDAKDRHKEIKNKKNEYKSLYFKKSAEKKPEDEKRQERLKQWLEDKGVDTSDLVTGD